MHYHNQSSLLRLNKFISDVAHRLYVLALIAELVAQASDMHIERPCLTLEIEAPDLSEQKLAVYDLTLLFREAA